MIGFWSSVPLAVIVASGATMAANLVYRLAGVAPPRQTSPHPLESVARDGLSVVPDPATPLVELQALAAKAAAETPGWRTITINLPESIHDPVLVAVDRGTGRQPSKSEDLLFDRATGELVERAGYPTFSRGPSFPFFEYTCHGPLAGVNRFRPREAAGRTFSDRRRGARVPRPPGSVPRFRGRTTAGRGPAPPRPAIGAAVRGT